MMRWSTVPNTLAPVDMLLSFTQGKKSSVFRKTAINLLLTIICICYYVAPKF